MGRHTVRFTLDGYICVVSVGRQYVEGIGFLTTAFFCKQKSQFKDYIKYTDYLDLYLYLLLVVIYLKGVL